MWFSFLIVEPKVPSYNFNHSSYTGVSQKDCVTELQFHDSNWLKLTPQEDRHYVFYILMPTKIQDSSTPFAPLLLNKN